MDLTQAIILAPVQALLMAICVYWGVKAVEERDWPYVLLVVFAGFCNCLYLIVFSRYLIEAWVGL